MSLLHLPDDVLKLISDNLCTAALSHVCKQTWAVLRRRHLTIHVSPEHATEWVANVLTAGPVRSLMISCRHLGDSDLQAFVPLKDLVSVPALLSRFPAQCHPYSLIPTFLPVFGHHASLDSPIYPTYCTT